MIGHEKKNLWRKDSRERERESLRLNDRSQHLTPSRIVEEDLLGGESWEMVSGGFDIEGVGTVGGGHYCLFNLCV